MSERFTDTKKPVEMGVLRKKETSNAIRRLPIKLGKMSKTDFSTPNQLEDYFEIRWQDEGLENLLMECAEWETRPDPQTGQTTYKLKNIKGLPEGEAQKPKPEWPTAPIDKAIPLLAREQQVLQCLADGLNNNAIAATLGVSHNSASKYRHLLFKRFGMFGGGVGKGEANEQARIALVELAKKLGMLK